MRLLGTLILLVGFVSTNAGAQEWAKAAGALNQVSAVDETTAWGVNQYDQVVRTKDSGKTWQRVPGTLRQVSALSYDSAWGVNGSRQIWRTNDGGKNWDNRPGRLKQVSAVDYETAWGVNDANDIVRTNDGGALWQQRSGKLNQISALSFESAWGVNAAGEIWRTKDGGANWENRPGQLKWVSAASYDVAAGVNANDGIYRTRDGGASWQEVPGSLQQISALSYESAWGVNAGNDIFVRVVTNAGAQAGGAASSSQVVQGDIIFLGDAVKPPEPQHPICKQWQKPTTDGICASNVFFKEHTFTTVSPFDEAKVVAREHGWVIASNEEVRLATQAFGLNAPKAGYTNETTVSAKGPNGFKVEQGTPKCPSCLTATAAGFFYLNEEEAGRVQPLPGSRPRDLANYPNSNWRHITEPTYAGLWSDQIADQHPAKVLYGLGDARLLRKAAATYLRKSGKPSGAAEVDAFLTKLVADSKLRYRFTPALLGEAFEAISTPRPDAVQRAFRSIFEQYMSYDRYRIDGITHTGWSDFKGDNPFAPPQRNDHAAPAANLLPKIPSVSEFQARNTNPMQIGGAGSHAIRSFLEPASYAGLPEFRNSNMGLAGQDMAAIAAGVGVGATLAGTAATLGLVSSAVFGATAVISTTSTTALIGGQIVTTTVSNLATITPALLASKGTIAFGSSVSLASSSAIAVTISVALAALIGKSFADLAQAEQLSLRLKTSLDAGPQPVDAYALVSAGDVGTRQANRTMAFSHLLKMLIAEPVDKGFLSVTRPEPPAPVSGYWACGGNGKLHIKQNGYDFTGSLTPSNGSPTPVENGEVEGFTLKASNLAAKVTQGAAKMDGMMTFANGQSRAVSCTRDKPLEFAYIQSSQNQKQFVHNQTGSIGVGEIESGWWSAQWKLEPGEGEFVKFQNRWRPVEYLHIQNGRLEVGPLADKNWWSAQWRIQYLENGSARIQNRWKPDQFLHLSEGKIVAGVVSAGSTSAQWIIE